MVIRIDQKSEEPLYLQIRSQIIAAIATGELVPGTALPSVRALASDLGINLHTVNKAYAVLRDEGYVLMRGRSGAYIADPCEDDRADRAQIELAKMEDGLFELALAHRARGGTWGEFLECAQEIRATNRSAAHLDALAAKLDAFERRQVASELTTGVFVTSAQAFLKLGIGTTVLVGATLLVYGQTDFMTYFAFLLVVTRVYDPVNLILQSIGELLSMRLSIRRTQELAAEKPMEGSTDFAPRGHDVVFEDVSFSYGDGEQVLRDVSFTAREGEVTALVGPSGSGKSTVAKLAARFWDADAGSVRVGGVNVADVDPETLLADYAEVFQDVVLFDDTVMGNIRLGRVGATDEEVLAAARAAMCDEFVSRMPQGYDTMIGENGGRLSGGERQRISIARAILKDAPVVLLDEATASLDVENETQVQQALSRLLAGKTVLVIAHRMRTVANADKIVVLKEGRVAEQGAPAELMAREGGLYRRMVELQTEASGWSLAS